MNAEGLEFPCTILLYDDILLLLVIACYCFQVAYILLFEQ